MDINDFIVSAKLLESTPAFKLFEQTFFIPILIWVLNFNCSERKEKKQKK